MFFLVNRINEIVKKSEADKASYRRELEEYKKVR